MAQATCNASFVFNPVPLAVLAMLKTSSPSSMFMAAYRYRAAYTALFQIDGADVFLPLRYIDMLLHKERFKNNID
jgi:hypothetical protein